MKDGKFYREGSDSIAEYLYSDSPENLNLARTVGRKCEKAGKPKWIFQGKYYILHTTFENENEKL